MNYTLADFIKDNPKTANKYFYQLWDSTVWRLSQLPKVLMTSTVVVDTKNLIVKIK